MTNEQAHVFLLSIGFSPERGSNAILVKQMGPIQLRAHVPPPLHPHDQVTINGSYRDARQMADTEGMLSRSVFQMMAYPVGQVPVDPSPGDILDRIEAVLAELPQPRNQEALQFAIASGDVDRVEEILAAGDFDLDVKLGRERGSMLHFARTPDMVEHLSRHGVDSNLRARDGRPPLFGARTEPLVAAFLQAGAFANAIDVNDRSALHKAQSVSIIKALVAAGANPAERDNTGGTPLHFQTALPSLCQLLALGVEVDVEDDDGDTPLTVQLKQDRLAHVGVLLSHGADPDRANMHGETPVFFARTLPALGLLVDDFSARVTVRSRTGKTALHGQQDPAAINFLCQRGVDPSDADQTGTTPLHLSRFVEVVRTLLAHRARIGACDQAGRTPLHLAALRADHFVVSELVQRGADVRLPDASGDTPLHLARTPHVAELLIRAGADPNAQNAHGDAPKIPQRPSADLRPPVVY